MHSYKCVFNLLILSLYFVLLSKSFKSKIRLFRMYNKLVSTYESASIRRFHFGRVDNIRANTPEALEWARAMVDETGNISAAEKLRLFRQAMQAQTDLMVQVNI
jgi:choline O-acetyltransferase